MPTSPENIETILEQLREVRAVFVLGRRAIPFIEEVFTFLEDIAPLLNEVRSSMHASVTEMPDATSQLESVTEATELATTEIMDIVDTTLEELNHLAQCMQAETCLDELEQGDRDLRQLLEGVLQDSSVREDAEAILENKQRIRAEMAKRLEEGHDQIASIRKNTNQIMLSLQVQDITAQQIASANHLIESIQQRLTDLVRRLGIEHDGRADAPQASQDEHFTFDPNARYMPAAGHQQRVDAMMKNGAEEEENAPSQEDIDALFEQAADDRHAT